MDVARGRRGVKRRFAGLFAYRPVDVRSYRRCSKNSAHSRESGNPGAAIHKSGSPLSRGRAAESRAPHCLVWGDCSLENLYMRGVRRSALAARQSGPVCRMDSHPRSTEALKREVSADGGGSVFSIRYGLGPYIWRADRRDLKLRVAVAMLLLLAAKLATIAVPFTFKWATDALTGEGSAPVAPSAWLVWALAAPI